MSIYLTEGSEPKGCLMVSIPPHLSAQIRGWSQENIKGENLGLDGEIETYIHATVVYGFSPDITSSDLISFIPDSPIFMSLGKIKRFAADENRPETDVLVVEVSSGDLTSLNSILKEKFSIESFYGKYNPHITLAYVIPGQHPELDGQKPFSSMVVSCTELVFSTADRTRTEIHIPDVISECSKLTNAVRVGMSFKQFIHASQKGSAIQDEEAA